MILLFFIYSSSPTYYYYLGDDCGFDLWKCNGSGSIAVYSDTCIHGCCKTFKTKSKCCRNDKCSGCHPSDIVKSPPTLPTTTNTSVSPSPTNEPENDVSSL